MIDFHMIGIRMSRVIFAEALGSLAPVTGF